MISPGSIFFLKTPSLILREFKLTLFGWVYPFFSFAARHEFKDQKTVLNHTNLRLLKVIHRTVAFFDVGFI